MARALVVFAALGLTSLAAAPAAAVRFGTESLINLETQGLQRLPAVAPLPGGGSLVAWQTDQGPGDVRARLLDARGAPIGGELRVPSRPPGGQYFPRAAALSGGRAVVMWTGASHFFARIFDSTGTPLGEEVILGSRPAPGGGMYLPSIAALPSGGFVVSWQVGDTRWSTLAAVFDRHGARVGQEVEVATSDRAGGHDVAVSPEGRIAVVWSERGAIRMRFLSGAGVPASEGLPVAGSAGEPNVYRGVTKPLFEADGTISIVWSRYDPGAEGPGLFVRRFSADGAPLGATRRLAGPGRFGQAIHAVTEPSGRRLLLWVEDGGRDRDSGVVGRFFDADWEPLGDEFLLNALTRGFQGEAAVTATAPGTFTVVWGSGEYYTQGTPSDGSCTVDGSFLGVVSRLVHADDLAPVTKIALGSGRFVAELSWRTGAEAGPGHAVSLGADTGAFWFLDPQNLELVVKVVDGRDVNGRFWVFLGGLTDVRYVLQITDTYTGARRTYRNPRGSLVSRADLRAFPGSGPALPREPPLPAACPSDPDRAALQGRRFVAEVSFVDPRTGTRSRAHAGNSGTTDTATFWFFAPAAQELVVKVLDARAVNGHFWVFVGALTNLEYDLVLTDRDSGETRTYHNPAGTLRSVADTYGFPD